MTTAGRGGVSICAREALEPLLQLAKTCFDQGQSVAEVLEVLMSA
ncbi:MAG: hypothetical protein ACFCVB_19415 [Nodosilinea sp.]